MGKRQPVNPWNATEVIPDFNDEGYLSPGVHSATLEEIEDRFGRDSEVRRAQIQSLHWLVDLARRAGVRRLIVNGSFVTDAVEPNDVDCVLLVDDSFPNTEDESKAEMELTAGLPFLQINLATREEFDFMVDRFFGTDRRGLPKGVIEVIAWN
jgi:hypothetical protein